MVIIISGLASFYILRSFTDFGKTIFEICISKEDFYDRISQKVFCFSTKGKYSFVYLVQTKFVVLFQNILNES